MFKRSLGKDFFRTFFQSALVNFLKSSCFRSRRNNFVFGSGSGDCIILMFRRNRCTEKHISMDDGTSSGCGCIVSH